VKKVNSYDTIVVFNPTMASEEIDKAASKIEDTITSNNGKVVSLNKWGIKKIESEAKGHKEGYYVYIKFDGPGNLVSILTKHYRVTDSIIRFITTRADEKKAVEPAKAAVPPPAPKDTQASA
jgi:small subunit ribosomal protein S6